MRQVRFFALFAVSCALVSSAQTQTSTPCPAPSAQRYTMLQNFSTAQGPNGPHFSGIIAQGRDGNMFTTAPDAWTAGQGTVFRIKKSGAVKVLHSFSGTDGAESLSG